MKAAKLVEIGSKMMELLSDCDIRMGDYKYLPLFADYERMVKNGDKVTFIIAFLIDKYKISEANVYRILRRFKRPVKY